MDRLQPIKKRSKGLSVAIFQLETHGVDKKVSAILTDTIVSQVSRIPDAEVIGSKEIDAMLNYEQKRQMAGCNDTSCAVALGGALGVDKILMGSIGKLGKSQVLDLKLIDIRKATIDTSINRRFAGDQDDDLLDVMPEALTQIFPWAEGTWSAKRSGTAGAAGVGVTGARPVGAAEAKRNPPASARAEVAPAYDKTPYLVWSLVSFGAAAALTTGGALFYKWADDTKNAAGRMTYQELNDTYRDKTLGTSLFFGTAGAAFTTGTVLLILGMRDGTGSGRASADEATVRPVVGVGSIGVTGAW